VFIFQLVTGHLLQRIALWDALRKEIEWEAFTPRFQQLAIIL